MGHKPQGNKGAIAAARAARRSQGNGNGREVFRSHLKPGTHTSRGYVGPDHVVYAGGQRRRPEPLRV